MASDHRSKRMFLCVCGRRLKDGRQMESRDGVVMTTDDNAHRLVIRETRDADAGVYKCVVHNTAGETACTATLSVQSTQSCSMTFIIIMKKNIYHQCQVLRGGAKEF